MRIILCGYHWAGCKALEVLSHKATDLFVYTHESPYYVPDLREACRNRGIPWTVDGISSSSLPFTPDVIASIYYRNIIDSDVLSVAGKKAFNFHPSLLPKYRGCSSLVWALINGEKYAGYTYHYLTKRIDAGDILLQKRMAIYPWDTGESLYYRVMFEAMNDLENVLELVTSENPGTPQNGEPSYYPRGCPFEGKISDDWPDEYIERFIRALIFPPLPPAQYKEQNIYNFDQYRKLLQQ